METQEIKSNLRKYYNQEAERRNSGEKQDWKVKLRYEFYRLAAQEHKKTLVELGAGTGQDSQFFMDNGLEVVAVDLSGEMVKICKEKNINAYELDFYHLSKLNQTFDCCWAMNSLLHVPKSDLKTVLMGIDAILNKSGIFFMGVYGGEDTEHHWTNDISTPRFFSFYSESTIKEILQDVFEIISFEHFIVGDNIDFQSVFLRKK